MYNSFTLAAKYLKYWLTASNSKGHGMHSPFVFQFILNVLNNGQHYVVPPEIKSLRKQLENDDTVLQVNDLGAGSRRKDKNRTVRQIAKSAVKPGKYSEMLFRLVKFYQPAQLIELGTSLGVTTAYLAMANPGMKITTIEGSNDIYLQAQKNFRHLQLNKIKSVQGNFDHTLPLVLSETQTIDIAYIDGNHLYEPTMRYFRHFLEKVHKGSILIFDDIHWSAEMEAAWREIKAHKSVTCTIDIFFMGFVFFRDEFREKQDFTVRF